MSQAGSTPCQGCVIQPARTASATSAVIRSSREGGPSISSWACRRVARTRVGSAGRWRQAIHASALPRLTASSTRTAWSHASHDTWARVASGSTRQASRHVGVPVRKSVVARQKPVNAASARPALPRLRGGYLSVSVSPRTTGPMKVTRAWADGMSTVDTMPAVRRAAVCPTNVGGKRCTATSVTR